MALSQNQIYLLKLLDLANKIECKTKVQKLIFLAEVEEKAPLTYNFERYHYGPFSFELSDDLNALKQTGFIEEKQVIIGSSEGFPIVKSTFNLTEDGKREIAKNEEKINHEAVNSINSIVKKWNDVPLEEVLNYVYSKYITDNRELATTK